MKAEEFKMEGDNLKRTLNDVTREFGLALIHEEITVYGVTLIYLNQFSGVECSFSPREGRGWHAIIGRLRDGAFPPHPIQIYENTQLDAFNIRDIASTRRDQVPSDVIDKIGENVSVLTAEDVATLLKRCCGEVLKGDFSSFETASAIVKERAQRLRSEFPRKGKEK